MTTSSLTGALRETLSLFDESGAPQTTSEVADHLDLGRRSTYERLERLVERSRLETKKVGASGRVWWRPEPGSTATSPVATGEWDGAAESLIDVLDGAEIGVFVLNDDFEVAWINQATERYFGLDRGRVLGRDKRRLVDERIAASIEESTTFAETVLATYDDNTYTEHFECRVTPGDGREERWLEHRSKPIRSGEYAGGRVELYYDVTDRKRTERARREDREQFESLIEAVEEYAIFTLDPEGRVQTCNSGAERIKGYRADEVIGEHVETFYTEADKATAVPERNLAAAAETGSLEVEGWRVRADGTRFWANVSLSAIRDDDGDLAGYAKVTRDMTDRRRTEQRLREEKAFVESLFDNQRDVVYAFDADGEFLRWNDRLRAVSGYTDDQIGEMHPLEFVADEATARAAVTFQRVIDHGETVTVELPFETATGETIPYEFTGSPIRNDEDDVVGVTGVGRDVAERKRRESLLQRQRDELEAEIDEVFERIDDGFLALDEDLRFRYVNDRASDLLSRSPSAILDEYIWDVLEPGRKAEAAFQEALETQEPTTFEEYYEPLDSWFENHVYPSTSGLSVYFQDVSERKAYQREIERSERRYRTLVENFPNGTVVLFDEDLRYLTAGGELYDGIEYAPEDLEGHTLAERIPESLRDALEPRYRAALDGEASEFECEFNDQIRNFRVFPVTDDEGDVGAGMAMSQEITERKARERKLERQREQLAALNQLNGVVRDITDAVIEQSTREEIEATVCERLADADSYEFAWIGDVDVATDRVTERAEAGVDGYLDDVVISVDPDDPRGRGPAGRAVRTREIQITRDALSDPNFEVWADTSKRYGFRSAAAIPIVHGDTLYGLIGVYADRPEAFGRQERQVLAQLGEVVGHAIAAIERKLALTSDEVTEIEFSATGVLDTFGVDPPDDGTIAFERVVPIGDGDFLEYGTVDESATETLHALVDRLPYFESVTVDESDADVSQFELRLSQPPVISAVAAHGGYLQQATIENGTFHATIHVPSTVEIRRLIDAVTDAYPTAELVRRQQMTRTDASVAGVHRAVTENLTDRQRAALEAAVHSGYFEWPRDATGEDVAESLDVAPPTFHQHIRRAQNKVFRSLLSAPA